MSDMVQITFTVKSEVRESMRSAATKLGIGIADLGRRALTQFLEELDKPKIITSTPEPEQYKEQMEKRLAEGKPVPLSYETPIIPPPKPVCVDCSKPIDDANYQLVIRQGVVLKMCPECVAKRASANKA